MVFQKKDFGPTSLGLDSSLSHLGKEEYPGGVRVSFALTQITGAAKRVVILKVNSWNHVLPMADVNPYFETLGQSLSHLRQILKDNDVSMSFSEKDAQVAGMVTTVNDPENKTVGVVDFLLTVPIRVGAGRGNLVFIDYPAMLKGYGVSNPMVVFVPQAMEWADSDYMFLDQAVPSVPAMA